MKVLAVKPESIILVNVGVPPNVTTPAADTAVIPPDSVTRAGAAPVPINI